MQKLKSPLLLSTACIAICAYLFLAMAGTGQKQSVVITSTQAKPPSRSVQMQATAAVDPTVIRGLDHRGMTLPGRDSIPIDPALEADFPYRQPLEIDKKIPPAVDDIDYLQSSLYDSDPSLRLQAVQILAEINNADSLGLLISALDDPQASIRLASIESLQSQRDNIVSISLEPLLYDPDKSVRLSAIDAIGSLEHPHSLYALAGLLGDHDGDIRLAAVIALGEIGTGEAALYLRHQLYDPDRRVRQNVLAILQELNEHQIK